MVLTSFKRTNPVCTYRSNFQFSRYNIQHVLLLALPPQKALSVYLLWCLQWCEYQVQCVHPGTRLQYWEPRVNI